MNEIVSDNGFKNIVDLGKYTLNFNLLRLFGEKHDGSNHYYIDKN